MWSWQIALGEWKTLLSLGLDSFNYRLIITEEEPEAGGREPDLQSGYVCEMGVITGAPSETV